MWNPLKLIGAVLFLLACLWVGWDEVIIRLTGERTTGTVVEVDDVNPEHAWWEFPVTLPDGSRITVVAEEHILIFVPEVGSKGTVIYDPADPENRVVFGSFPSPMETLTVLFTLGAILVAWSNFLDRKRRRTEPPAQAGAESPVRRTTSTPFAQRRAEAHSEDRRRAAQRLATRQRSAQRRAHKRKG